MKLFKKPLLLLLAALVGSAISLGCSATPAQKPVPKTAAQAGIVTADSKTCEDCHLDPSKISSYEKPAQVASGGETKGG